MKQIALFKYTGLYEDYDNDNRYHQICNFEEVTDEEYDLLKQALPLQKYDSPIRYFMIETSNVKEVKESLKDSIAIIEKNHKNYQDQLKKAKLAEQKRKETLAKTKKERDRKKLEQLKKQFGES